MLSKKKWCNCIGNISIRSRLVQEICNSPPIIVRMSEACPGQSTRVNCRLSYCFWPPLSRTWSGRSTVKEEKPRSSVIPLSRDWGFLSKAAVDAVLLSALASEVFPLSTCPSTPTLKFNVLMWLSAESDILSHSRTTFCAPFANVFILSWTTECNPHRNTILRSLPYNGFSIVLNTELSTFFRPSKQTNNRNSKFVASTQFVLSPILC